MIIKPSQDEPTACASRLRAAAGGKIAKPEVCVFVSSHNYDRCLEIITTELSSHPLNFQSTKADPVVMLEFKILEEAG